MKSLVDQHGRKIDYLRISITDRCNLRCIYCMPESGVAHKSHEEILTYAEIMKIVVAASYCGIKKVRITGGEPLVRKDVVDLVAAIAKTANINDFSLTTNGMLLGEYAEELKNAGLRRINISLDSLVREKCEMITRRDALNKVVEGIDAALRVGLGPVKINVVVIRGVNDDEIAEFAKLTCDKPLHVRFIEFMPIGDNSIWGMEKFIPNDEVKNLCRELGELKEEGSQPNGNTSSYRLGKAKGTISFISPISSPFCGGCGRLRLTSDGKLRLCLGSAEEIDLLSIVRNSKFSSEHLIEAFERAAILKPKGHRFNCAPHISGKKTMCQIGG